MSKRQIVTRRQTDRALLARLAAERDGHRFKGTAVEQINYWWERLTAEQRLDFLRRVRIG